NFGGRSEKPGAAPKIASSGEEFKSSRRLTGETRKTHKTRGSRAGGGQTQGPKSPPWKSRLGHARALPRYVDLRQHVSLRVECREPRPEGTIARWNRNPAGTHTRSATR